MVRVTDCTSFHIRSSLVTFSTLYLSYFNLAVPMRKCVIKHSCTSSFYTLSGRIGKMVASHAAVARWSPADVALIYTMHEALREYCP